MGTRRLLCEIVSAPSGRAWPLHRMSGGIGSSASRCMLSAGPCSRVDVLLVLNRLSRRVMVLAPHGMVCAARVSIYHTRPPRPRPPRPGALAER